MSLTATATFKELWSAKVQRNADDALVIGALTTRRYEGELKNGGDTVHITQWPDVFTETNGAVTYPENYTRNADLTDQPFQTSTRALTVQQEKALRTKVDDVDDHQSMFKLIEGLGRRFGYAFARLWENYLWSYAGSDAATAAYSGAQNAGGIYGGPGAANTLATGDYYDLLVDYDTNLDTANCADGRRCVVVPPWFCGGLKKEATLTSITTEAVAKEVVIGGMVGHVAGFDIIKTNVMAPGYYWAQSLEDDTAEVPTAVTGTNNANTAHIFGGNLGESIAFVKQISKQKITEAPGGFYSNVMGLSVHGGMLLDPTSHFDALVTHA
jgi:hypothetical protein